MHETPHTQSPHIVNPGPPTPMASLTMDLFHLPAIEWEGETLDTLIVCVNRHSVWIVAIPSLNKGLTGEKVAKAMIKNQWRPFGVPSLIFLNKGHNL